jgi:hypothetical protein
MESIGSAPPRTVIGDPSQADGLGQNFNRDAFDAAAKQLRAQGHTVFNPCEPDVKNFGVGILDNETGDPAISESEHGFSLRKALETDLVWICRKATHIALLPGWERSRGARAEFELAVALRLEFIYLDDVVPRRRTTKPKRPHAHHTHVPRAAA